MKQKPRVRFCWLCARKLRGNHFTEIEHDGHLRIFHKSCAELAKKKTDAELAALCAPLPIIF
jgi:hypothetical protein